jgi:hypothetical protein
LEGVSGRKRKFFRRGNWKIKEVDAHLGRDRVGRTFGASGITVTKPHVHLLQALVLLYPTHSRLEPIKKAARTLKPLVDNMVRYRK